MYPHDIFAFTQAAFINPKRGPNAKPRTLEQLQAMSDRRRMAIAVHGFNLAGHKKSAQTRAKIGATRRARGHGGSPGPLSAEAKRKISENVERRQKISASLTGKTRSEAVRRQMSERMKDRVAIGLCNFTVDGRGRERATRRLQEMDGIEYKLWRRAVFARDDYTCQFCGSRGGKLVADHFRPWSIYPALRYDVGNGRTLCMECDKLTLTYGGRMRFYVETARLVEAILGSA